MTKEERDRIALCLAFAAREGLIAPEERDRLAASLARLRGTLAQYADRSRWESLAVPLANGGVRLCATFDGGWGVAEAALQGEQP